VTWSTGAAYFHPEYGLKAGKLADAVQAVGPLLVDDTGNFWVYGGGVWRPDQGEVGRRIVDALGERYRPSHARAVREVLAARLERILPAPVGRYLNFRNGMLRWDAAGGPALVEHHPEFMSTVQLPLDWNPDATCRAFDDFVAAAIPVDDRARAWQILGYLMMSGNPLQRLFMLIGSGGNGKGVYLNVVRALLGEDNVSAVPLQEFSESQFATAELYGKLANLCGDIDSTFISNTGRIKELSGDDKMKGERKFGQPFYFRFWGKAMFSANAIPGAADSSRGWLRRWEVVEFPYTPTKPDPLLSTRVTEQESLEGIAVRAVHALCDLMATQEFVSGESSDKARSEFAEKANKVIRWMNDPDSNVTQEEGVFCKGTALLKAFRAWEEHDSGNAQHPTGSQRFTELAGQAGLRRVVRRGNRGFVGLRIAPWVMIPERDKQWVNVEPAGGDDVHQSAPAAPDPDEQLGLDLG
jgi:P4 family phage/plasmid primase-like protien